MKKIIALLVVAVLAGGGWLYYSKTKKAKKVHFDSATATRGTITEIVDTTGDVEPLNRVTVNSPVGGRVDKLLVEEGDKVKAGQILSYLSSTDRVAIVDAAKASGAGEVSKWEDAYKPTPILSPLEGTVILRAVVQGQTIASNTTIYALSDDLIVVAQVDESDIGRIKIGQRADIILDSYPNRKTKGTVFQLLQEGKNVSNVITYNVKIRPDTIPPFFKSGMTTDIKITMSSKKDIVMLPIATITENADGTKTVLKGDKMNPQPAQVKTGLQDDVNAEIISGVDEGETVYYKSTFTAQQNSASNPFMPSGPKAGQNNQASKAARRMM